MTSRPQRTKGGVFALLATLTVVAVVSACRPGPPPTAPQSEPTPGSPSPDSAPTPSRAPETFTLDETAALYEEIRGEMENPDSELVARLGLDPEEIQENTREFEIGTPYEGVPGLRDSLHSFEQRDFSSAHDQLEAAFEAFILGKCFATLASGQEGPSAARLREECIVLPEEQVIAVDPWFDYLPEPGKAGLGFSVLRQEAALKIVTLLRILAARAESAEARPSPVGTPSPTSPATQ